MLLTALHNAGYKQPTSIQQMLIPAIAAGQNILAIAPTGSGKTEAFAIPLLAAQLNNNKLSEAQSLVLSPTRELAIQTAARINRIAEPLNLSCISIYGGVTYSEQTQALDKQPHVIVATPGRLLDLQAQGLIDLGSIACIVLDEVDEMLALGFLKEVNQLLGSISAAAQRVFVSATGSVELEKIAKKQLPNLHTYTLEAEQSRIQEHALFVDKADKKELIAYLIADFSLQQLIVFTRTTHAVDRIVQHLQAKHIAAQGLYADKKQAQRADILQNFRAGSFQVLVATDLATRGLDIPNLSAVINYEVPDMAATYLHRIGRTGRRAEGQAFTFCDGEENNKLIALQIELKKSLPVYDKHPYPLSWQKMQSSSNKSKGKKR